LKENVDKIMKEKATMESELETLIQTSLEQLWLHELLVLEKEYNVYREGRIQIQKGSLSSEKKKSVVKKIVKK
jgi:hypothetical protein